MSDEAALLAAIRACPNEDTPRLMYADWLDENATESPCRSCKGKGEIRGDGMPQTGKPCAACGGVALSPHSHRKGTGRASDGRRERAEFIRVQCEIARIEIAPGHLPMGVGRERLLLAELDLWERLWKQLYPVPVGEHWNGWPWLSSTRRGFVETFEGSAACWLAHADAILAAHPVRAVKLTTLPGVELLAPAEGGYVHRMRGRSASVVGRYGAAYEDVLPRLLVAEWPGVEFKLPEGEAVPA